jgi:hypothetical protein
LKLYASGRDADFYWKIRKIAYANFDKFRYANYLLCGEVYSKRLERALFGR